jgi:hypothetical protein
VFEIVCVCCSAGLEWSKSRRYASSTRRPRAGGLGFEIAQNLSKTIYLYTYKSESRVVASSGGWVTSMGEETDG